MIRMKSLEWYSFSYSFSGKMIPHVLAAVRWLQCSTDTEVTYPKPILVSRRNTYVVAGAATFIPVARIAGRVAIFEQDNSIVSSPILRKLYY